MAITLASPWGWGFSAGTPSFPTGPSHCCWPGYSCRQTVKGLLAMTSGASPHERKNNFVGGHRGLAGSRVLLCLCPTPLRFSGPKEKAGVHTDHPTQLPRMGRHLPRGKHIPLQVFAARPSLLCLGVPSTKAVGAEAGVVEVLPFLQLKEPKEGPLGRQCK